MEILVVEDDKANANLIMKLLKANQYSPTLAENFAQGLEAIENVRFDLIILDWNLPDGSGFSLLQEIRSLLIDSQVLMLSANSDINFRVEALDNGADDYLCKPYSHLELTARVNSLLRRNSTNKNMSLKIGNITINKNNNTISKDEEVVNFTSAEYIIFTTLAFTSKKIFTKFELLDLIHKEYANSSSSNIIEVHIKNIRKKLNQKDIIQTVRGVGYKIRS